MSFSSWTRNSPGNAVGLPGCSSSFMAFDMKHTSVNLAELGFSRSNTHNHHNHHHHRHNDYTATSTTATNATATATPATNTTATTATNGADIWASSSPATATTATATATTATNIWSSSPADSDHDSWLRARRESSGSSADSGISRSLGSVGGGSFDDHALFAPHALTPLAVAMEKTGIHPFGKISRPTSSTSSSSSNVFSSNVFSPFDTSKVLFPLNPVAKDFVPAPKSWAAIVSAPNKGMGVPNKGMGVPNKGIGVSNKGIGVPNKGIGVPNKGIGVPNKSVGQASGRPKAAPSSGAMKGPDSPAVSLPSAWSNKDSPSLTVIGPSRVSAESSRKSDVTSNSFVPAFIQAQHDRSLVATKTDHCSFVTTKTNHCSFVATKTEPSSDSSGWTLMNGRSKPFSAPTETTERVEPAEPVERVDESSPEALIQRIRQVQRVQREKSFDDCEKKDDFFLENGRFFVLKPFSEKDVFEAILSSEWSSSAYGAELLDEVYQVQGEKGRVYLLFSVNGSGQFCGMAHMTSRVKRQASIWEAQRNSGRFHIQWDLIKDVPNSVLRHISIDARGTKPVTNCRDATEMTSVEAQKVVKVIQTYDSTTNILETFAKNLKDLKDRRNAKRTAGSTKR